MKKVGIVIVCLFMLVFIQPVFAHDIKIGLITNVSSLRLGTSTYAPVINSRTNKTIYMLDPMRNYEFRADSNNILIKIGGKYYSLDTDEIAVRPDYDGYVSAKSKWYRGIFIVKNINGALVLINKLDMEDYLRGVVPSEMPSSWAFEAHKAQAVAARSYAYANLGKRGKYGYDLKDTPEDQAYNGASAETDNTDQAVKDTEGIVILYDAKIIPAYYSASAGGQTVTAGQVWSRDLPYVRSVPSFDGNVKKNGHGVGMSQHGANNLAKQGYYGYQILQYFYKNITFARIR